jgi:hypothetical protein
MKQRVAVLVWPNVRTMFVLLGTLVLVTLAAAAVLRPQQSDDHSSDDPLPAQDADDGGSRVLDVPADPVAGPNLAIDVYRGPLLPGEHPKGWVKYYPVVALVRFDRVLDARTGTIDGLPTAAPPIVYTPLSATVIEYIKGSGPSTLSLTQWGGSASGLRMDLDFAINEGATAVVFLIGPKGTEPRRIDNAYVIDGDTARSELDQKSLPVDELLSGLREAAAEEASATGQ